ncbi:sodium:calcium antiporter [Halobaculum litoreum]|uniref:Sodium:calcium antiporter n=1 Tax=Halobaculum litoreum TaxID=3031998 RepID=A0ABD5XPM0_9EURY
MAVPAAALAVDAVLVAAGVAALWAGARLLVGSSVRLARRLGLSDLLIGVTVVAVGTSSPEIVVTLRAALTGAGELAVGNVVGSNVYNLAVVLGVVAVVGSFPVDRRIVHRDGVALVAATAAAAAAVADLRVTAVEGRRCWPGWSRTPSSRSAPAPSPAPSAATPPTPPTARSPAARRRDRRRRRRPAAGRPGGPVDAGPPAGDGAGPRRGARRRRPGGRPARRRPARRRGGPDRADGRGLRVGDRGTVVAAGTSTPEFAVSLVAVRQGSLGVSVGNVVGSSVFNVLGVLGLASLVTTLTVGPEALWSVAWLVALTVVVVAALWSGRRLSRVEGVALALSEVVRWALNLLRVVG